MLSAITDLLEFPRLGCWWDMTPRQTFKDVPGLVKKIREARLEDFAVEVNRQTDKAFEFSKWDAGELLRFRDLLRKEDLGQLTLMVWPRPDREFLSKLLHLLPATALQCGAFAIEFDAEGGNWADDHVDGFRDLDEAGRFLMAGMREKWGGLLGVNFHTGRLSKSLSELADYIAPQAYSNNAGDDDYEGRYEVVNMQMRGWRKAKSIEDEDGKVFIIMGLAAYRQKYPGHTEVEAMFAAAEAAIDLGAAGLRWWSAKHILGHHDNGYAAEAIAEVYSRFRD